MNRRSALVLMLGPVVCLTAHSEVYMSDLQAAQTIFPGGKFTKTRLTLSPEEIKKIKARGPQVAVLKGSAGQAVFIDQVLGKHEFITYAVGISSGKVAGVEILEYRETYGGQIRDERWRRQFTGRDAASPLKLGKDIQNISGATISSAHVTAGIKRVLQTYDCVKNRL